MPRETLRSGKAPSHARKPFQPALGRDIGPVEDVDTETRAFLARLVMISSVVAMVIAAGYSLTTGSYGAIATVWAIVGPIVGAVINHYFGSQRG